MKTNNIKKTLPQPIIRKVKRSGDYYEKYKYSIIISFNISPNIQDVFGGHYDKISAVKSFSGLRGMTLPRAIAIIDNIKKIAELIKPLILSSEVRVVFDYNSLRVYSNDLQFLDSLPINEKNNHKVYTRIWSISESLNVVPKGCLHRVNSKFAFRFDYKFLSQKKLLSPYIK